MEEFTFTLLLLILGLFTGGLIGWLLAKMKFNKSTLSNLNLEADYVSIKVHEIVLNELKNIKLELKSKEEDRLHLEVKLAAKERDLLYLEEKMTNWKADFAGLQKQAHVEFENIANRIFEEKSKRFVVENKNGVNNLLQPLRENIQAFGQDIERRFSEEAKEKVSLRKELEQLKELNLQLSTDAQMLASALKGDSKFQGDWGEFQLELLLEKAGLSKGIHFETQANFKDDEGHDKRPDMLVRLPEGKHLIIDSKVSLKAYERFFNSKEEEKRKRYLKAHLDSIRNHVKDLSRKKYQMIYDIDSPDYVILFIPLEPAFSLAVQHDSKLFVEALERNVVIVTSSTLLATMRTVSFIWKQEKQKKNVFEIARQSGLLYDKLVNFVNDLKEIGQRLDAAQGAWSGAMNKLSDSKKYGDTLIGRAEKIRQLGAKSSKHLPKELVE